MRRIAFVVALLTLAALGTSGLASAGGGKTVSTRGDEVLRPNQFVRTDLRFSPGKVTIQSGETVSWTHADNTDAPHTVTLATPDQLVQSIGDLFLEECEACDAAQDAAIGGHFSTDPPTLVLDGDGEFNDPGDSLLFFHGDTVSAEINAPAGTTLLYFCAIHPWMQGSISVAQ